jgi:hypothetical protein
VRSGRSQLQQLTPLSVGISVALSYAAGLRRPAERDGTMLRADWRPPMLRVEFQGVGKTMIMRLEGRFVGLFVEDTRDLVTRSKIPPRLVVNLSEVTFVDAAGEEMLSWLARIGGKFIADKCYPLHVCERLHLPMAPKRAGGVPSDNATRSQTF